MGAITVHVDLSNADNSAYCFDATHIHRGLRLYLLRVGRAVVRNSPKPDAKVIWPLAQLAPIVHKVDSQVLQLLGFDDSSLGQAFSAG